jgi:protein TonB
VFDEVTRKQGRGRAFRRVAWLAGSSLFHVGLVVALASAPAIASRSPGEMVIDVKFVKGQPVPAEPLARPAVPAAPPPPRRSAAPDRPRPRAAPPAPLVQPRDVPGEIPPPSAAPPPEEPDPGADEGVVGGIAGAAEAGSPLLPEPPARLDFDERSMTQPVYLSGPSPEYTRRALRHEVEGQMLLHCVITVDGEVRDCRVLRGLPFMDEVAVEALQRRRYRPATRNGQPVEVVYPFRIHLRLPR